MNDFLLWSMRRNSELCRCSVDLCYLTLKQWVVQFNNEKCYLLNYVLLIVHLPQPYTYPYSNAHTVIMCYIHGCR